MRCDWCGDRAEWLFVGPRTPETPSWREIGGWTLCDRHMGQRDRPGWQRVPLD